MENKVKVTFSEILEMGAWIEFCNKYEIND